MTDRLMMDPPTMVAGIPTSYAIRTSRPPARRRTLTVPPGLIADLEDTLERPGGSKSCLSFVVETMTPTQIRHLAARLNEVGHNSPDFSVRTRKGDGVLSAWAVPKQPTRTKKATA